MYDINLNELVSANTMPKVRIIGNNSLNQ